MCNISFLLYEILVFQCVISSRTKYRKLSGNGSFMIEENSLREEKG